MTIYFVLLLVIIVLYLIFPGEKGHSAFTKAAFISMFMLYGLRNAYSIGIDSASSYLNTFIKYTQVDWVYNYKNFGFFAFQQFMIKITGGNYQIFVSVIAAFVMYSFYRLVKKYSVNSYISVMWFIGMLYYIFMFSALKQSLAMAFLTYAFDAIIEKKVARFYCFVVIAALFHIPALVFLPAYLISKMRVSRSYFVLLFAVFGFVFIFRSQILGLMSTVYDTGETMNTGNVQFLGNKVLIMLAILVFAFLMRIPDETDQLYRTLLLFMGLSAVLQTFCYYNNIFERLTDYYYQFSILFMPLLFDRVGYYYGQYDSRLGEGTLSLAFSFGPVVISVFAIWRFLDYLVNLAAPAFIPFRFFWQ